MSRYRWEPEEAQTIFHDAWLLARQHVLERKIGKISIAYLKEVARKIGANKYRRWTREPDFVRLEKANTDRLEHGWQEQYGIQVFEDPPETTQVLHALSLLEDHCQQLIQLRYVKELSHKEIARQLGTRTAGSCKSQLSRCVKYLKKCFHSIIKTDDL